MPDVMTVNALHPELASIIEADRAARRDVENARARLVAREAADLQRLAEARDGAFAAARAQLERELEAIDAATRQRVHLRSVERERLRDARRVRAREALDAAAADYIRILRGHPGGESVP